MQRLEGAVRYRAERLAGCFEEWVLPERLRLAEAFLGALHQVVALLEELLDRPQALQWARRAVAADPLCEESQHDLIRLLVPTRQLEAPPPPHQHAEQGLA